MRKRFSIPHQSILSIIILHITLQPRSLQPLEMLSHQRQSLRQTIQSLRLDNRAHAALLTAYRIAYLLTCALDEGNPMTLPFTFDNSLGLRRHVLKALLPTSLKLRRTGRINTLLLLIAGSSCIPLMAMDERVTLLNDLAATGIAQPTMITIPVPGENKAELLDISENEPISYQTFEDLLTDCHTNGLNYSIARVETHDSKNKTDHVHYYDARMLNEWIKNNRRRHYISTAYRNPNNALPMQKIDYFKISPTSNNAATFQCSYNDHFLHSDPENLWSETINDPLYNEFRIARQWHYGSKFRAQDFEKAYRCYERLSQQTIHPQLAGDAKLLMAAMWCKGQGRDKNLDTAIAYYTQVTDQPGPPTWQSINAMLNIADIVRDLGATTHLNNQDAWTHVLKAFRYCESIIHNPLNKPPSVVAYAKFTLGFLYCYILYPSDLHIERAHQYLNEAANQQDCPRTASQARMTLEQIDGWRYKLLYKFVILDHNVAKLFYAYCCCRRN